MNPTEDDLGFAVPLSLTVHQQAQAIAERQSSPARSKQAYLNTLAVLAMQQYFDCLGLTSDVSQSSYQDPVLGVLSNVADLVLVGLGSLECCPVMDGTTVCLVAPETWNHSPASSMAQRVGYVAVKLAADLRSASPVGFLKEVSTTEIPLKDWRSLEFMLEQLQPVEIVEKQAATQNSSVSSAIAPFSTLSQWLKGEWESHWETLENLLNPQQPQLSFRGSRPPESQTNLSASRAENPTDRPEENGDAATEYTSLAKTLNLMLEGEEFVALSVGIKAAEQIASETYDILVKLFSIETEQLLPPQLTVQVLDQDDKAVMKAEARQTSMIQLEFQGQVAECFSLKVSLGNFEQVEAFQI